MCVHYFPVALLPCSRQTGSNWSDSALTGFGVSHSLYSCVRILEWKHHLTFLIHLFGFQENFLGSSSKIKMHTLISYYFCCILYFLYGDNALYIIISKWAKSVFHLLSFQPADTASKQNESSIFQMKKTPTEKCKYLSPNPQGELVEQGWYLHVL